MRAYTHGSRAHWQRVSTTFLTQKKSQIFLVLLTGFEPRSFGFWVWHSTNWAMLSCPQRHTQQADASLPAGCWARIWSARRRRTACWRAARQVWRHCPASPPGEGPPSSVGCQSGNLTKEKDTINIIILIIIRWFVERPFLTDRQALGALQKRTHNIRI